MRAYLPSLLPKFVALFGEAERGGGYELVRPALACLEALGSALEGHLPLLLPALTRLINPSGPPFHAVPKPSLSLFHIVQGAGLKTSTDPLVGAGLCPGRPTRLRSLMLCPDSLTRLKMQGPGMLASITVSCKKIVAVPSARHL